MLHPQCWRGLSCICSRSRYKRTFAATTRRLVQLGLDVINRSRDEDPQKSAMPRGAAWDKLDPILDACVAVYQDTLSEDQQVDFKGQAKAFCRTYDFLASINVGTNAGWEKLSIPLNFLVTKLPAPREQDLAQGIIDAIDMDTYRVDKQVALKIVLTDVRSTSSLSRMNRSNGLSGTWCMH